MSGFHEVRFPDNIAYGATGGPEFATTVVVTGAGHEQRNVDWAEARCRWDVASGLKDQAQLDELIAFFRARKGKAFGFRFRDWTDYKATGQLVGTGDGAIKTFQLVKRYLSGSVVELRTVTKPVAGTVHIYKDAVEQLSGWSVVALLILWTEAPGNEGIFRSGSANTGNWLWMLSGGKLWGRQANVNSPASGSGPLITAGWHTLARVWDGQQVRQYVDGLRTNTTAVTATGSWPLYRFGFQFTGAEALDEAYVPFFGAFGAAWDDAMVARWSANPLGMMWPERDAAFVTSGGEGPPAATRRPVVVIAAG